MKIQQWRKIFNHRVLEASYQAFQQLNLVRFCIFTHLQQQEITDPPWLFRDMVSKLPQSTMEITFSRLVELRELEERCVEREKKRTQPNDRMIVERVQFHVI